MATRIQRVCDQCADDGTDTAAEPYGPFWGRTVDLCDEHAARLAWLETLVSVRGAPVDAPKRRGRPRARAEAFTPAETLPGIDPRAPRVSQGFHCPLCSQEAPTQSALTQHLKAKHGVSIMDLFDPVVCPVCGVEFERVNGAGSHIANAHKIRGGMVAAYWWATEHGDPAGVAADSRARWETMLPAAG